MDGQGGEEGLVVEKKSNDIVFCVLKNILSRR